MDASGLFSSYFKTACRRKDSWILLWKNCLNCQARVRSPKVQSQSQKDLGWPYFGPLDSGMVVTDPVLPLYLNFIAILITKDNYQFQKVSLLLTLLLHFKRYTLAYMLRENIQFEYLCTLPDVAPKVLLNDNLEFHL